ncbi:MAG: ThiF family adenylyltransferase, partial [Rhodospirillales bacterium]|nr:ThiF family adenylyltransferase [Rhodospirillales bacterium]
RSRRAFPVVIHQNATQPGSPPSLCLYYETAASALRTWTPEGFLRKIQFWLAGTARGTLHAADQPVEALFFSSRDELVLPWNFEELVKGGLADYGLVVVRSCERAGGGATYTLRVWPREQALQAPGVAPILVELPSIKHANIRHDPPSLGALDDLFRSRGSDALLPLLTSEILKSVGAGGARLSQDAPFTVILMTVPIARVDGGAAERYFRRAYLLNGGLLQLGLATGALNEMDGKVWPAPTGNFLANSTSAWRELVIGPGEVLSAIGPAAARYQSGLSDAGPACIVVGAGSLGATMLDLWTRSGWGQWSTIDADHIRPHNLVRHPALAADIGKFKAEVAAQHHQAVMQGAGKVEAIVADACDPENLSVAAALIAGELIVDASAALEYPRYASTQDRFARHVSTFLTPSANASVLMIESRDRSVRLRTLEAQYYRALINEPWGADHLNTTQPRFWSGAGCRDISMIQSYSAIALHAAGLAEQVRLAYLQDAASVRIWIRDRESGAIAAHDVAARAERAFAMDDLTVFIDDGLHEKLTEMRNANLPNETGGVLLGYFDLRLGWLVVVDALPAPADSCASRTGFDRGVEGTLASVVEVSRRTAEIVRYIGEWHSHPPSHSAAPSVDDFLQGSELALGMAEEGLPALQLIVGRKGQLSVIKIEAR